MYIAHLWFNAREKIFKAAWHDPPLFVIQSHHVRTLKRDSQRSHHQPCIVKLFFDQCCRVGWHSRLPRAGLATIYWWEWSGVSEKWELLGEYGSVVAFEAIVCYFHSDLIKDLLLITMNINGVANLRGSMVSNMIEFKTMSSQIHHIVLKLKRGYIAAFYFPVEERPNTQVYMNSVA